MKMTRNSESMIRVLRGGNIDEGRWSVKDDDVILGYLNLLFQTTYYKQYCIGITNKSGQAFYNLSRQKLVKCMIPIAPIKEMIRIVTKYESLDL